MLINRHHYEHFETAGYLKYGLTLVCCQQTCQCNAYQMTWCQREKKI
jgi:hypothetical protein